MAARFRVRYVFFLVFLQSSSFRENSMHAKEERVLRPVPGREARLTHPGCRTTLIILAVAWAARALAILLFSSCAEATAMARCTAGAAPPLPLVSVIIPCHNAMPWLDACLASDEELTTSAYRERWAQSEPSLGAWRSAEHLRRVAL